MYIEPLQIPMMYGRVAIASVALTHALFATFIVGSSMMGASFETLGQVSGKARYERLARLIAFTLILSTATVSFFGVILVFFLNIFWPQFWSALFRIMFWPLLLEALFFLAEAVFAYAWYYTWDWASTGFRKKLHITCGWLAAGSSLIAMVMIDIVASYMLTPRPPSAYWQMMFNPTMLYLDSHRIVGNLAWTGFGLAGICAIAYLRARAQEDRDFYRWAGGACFLVGFGALLIMPIIGYQYLLQIRYVEPQAFYTLMLGPRSWLFNLVALLYSLLIITGSIYMLRSVWPSLSPESSARVVLPLSLGLLVVAGIVLTLPYHLQHIPFVSRFTTQDIIPWGKMQPNKYFAIAFLVMFGLINWLYFSRSFRSRWWQSSAEHAVRDNRTSLLLMVLTVCSILIMLTMGWARETARAFNGYLIYGQFSLADEQSTYRAERAP